MTVPPTDGAPPPWNPPTDGAPPSWNPPPPLPSLETEPARELVPWRWWESIIVFMLANVTAAIVAAIIAFATSSDDLRTALYILGFQGSLALWVIMWPRVRHGRGLDALGVRSEQLASDIRYGLSRGVLAWLVSALVIGSITIKIVDALSSSPVQGPNQLDFSGTPSVGILILTAIGVMVAAPIAEELFFRGFVFQAFRRSFALPVAVGISSLIFMLVHAPTFIIFPSIFALAIALALMFEQRRSVISSMVAHSVFNTIGFIAYLISLQKG